MVGGNRDRHNCRARDDELATSLGTYKEAIVDRKLRHFFIAHRALLTSAQGKNMAKRGFFIYSSIGLFLLGVLPTIVVASINLANVPCGKASINSRFARVVGGHDAVPREFPWLVSITRMGGHFCGGTIINSRFILTAAHCLCSGTTSIPARQLRVTLGEHNLKGPETPASIVEGVLNVNVHPGHKCGQYVDDIAILELAGPISWSDSVQPACLPSANGEPGYTGFGGSNAVAAGWGWLGEDRSRNKRADILQKVDVRVVENDICREWYESQGKKTRVGRHQMCAGHESGGHDTCWADSGGPLMVGSTVVGDGTMVVGVVSSGVGCARPRLPGIYTRISEYIPWITQQTLAKR